MKDSFEKIGEREVKKSKGRWGGGERTGRGEGKDGKKDLNWFKRCFGAARERRVKEREDDLDEEKVRKDKGKMGKRN